MRHAVLHVDVNEQRQVTIHADGVDPSSVDVESP
jgi:hypothetical protein